jgi:histidine triad (HIT) family protein
VPLEHEDERCVALRDPAPRAPYHVVVLPRRHMPALLGANDVDAALLGHLMLVAARLIRGSSFAAGEWRLVLGEPTDGKPVPHLHLHVLAGRTFSWPPG